MPQSSRTPLYMEPYFPMAKNAAPQNKTKKTLSLTTARRLSIRTQGLDNHTPVSSGKEGTTQVVERLGYVQIDTIAVIERAHDHILWNHHPGFTSDMLGELLAIDRRVFEYWAHAAAYVPMADYRYYLPRMATAHNWRRESLFRKENKKLVKEVYERIRREGAMASADFDYQDAKRGTWWDWKPAKRALEVLFNTGELMVSARRRFQRVYDLPERVVPGHIDTQAATPDEAARHFARRALSTLGLASLPQIRKLYANHGARKALDDLLEAGEAVAVQIENQEAPYYALTATLDNTPRQQKNHLHLLSPFDNITIDRDRLLALFDFHYRIECYTPAPKREYGYFTLPILWNGSFIGRLDPKAERKSQTFLVRNIVFEPGFKDYDALLPALAKALHRFAAFNGCTSIRVERTKPGKFKAPLNRILKNN